jgi:hypothetical protein
VLDLHDFCPEVGQETSAKLAHLDSAVENAKPVQRPAPLVNMRVSLVSEPHVPVNFGGRFSTKALSPSLASLLRVTMPA